MKKALLFLVGVIITSISVYAETKDNWIISTSSKDNYNGVTLANGRIGIVSGKGLFEVSDIVMNGVYDKESERGVSRIVRGPLFTNISVAINGHVISDSDVKDWKQCLNMRESFLQTDVELKNASISYSYRALRNLQYMGMLLVEIVPKEDISLRVANKTLFPEELSGTSSVFKMLRDGIIDLPVYTSVAKTRTGMCDLASCSTFMFDGAHPLLSTDYGTGHDQIMQFDIKLQRHKKFRFALVGSLASSSDFFNPVHEAERMTIYALRSSIDDIIRGHERAWGRLWSSDIIIEGDNEAQKDIRLALYSLYSFIGKGTRQSIAPMGLSTVTGYNGHVFWDAELWMFPPLLMTNADLARSMVDYRYDRLGKAKQRALQYGYEGCMYPWESDNTGEEATPTWCLTGPFEHHITADVGIAFWNYWCVTKDIEWLRSEGYPVIKNVADFWASRVVSNEDGTYSIKNVVGANEFAQNVDDNAFTNGSAKRALMNAAKAASALGLKANDSWMEIADHIAFHYMPDGVMMENKTYKGEIIKQADANLCGFPLNLVTDSVQIKKDLDYYETKIFEDGPAMGNAILSILHAQLGDGEKAYELFRKSYLPNKRPPFGVLSESAFSNNPYFCTGAGGLLQTVLCGFGGLRITDEGIVQVNPILPKAWKSLTLKGIGPDHKTYIVR